MIPDEHHSKNASMRSNDHESQENGRTGRARDEARLSSLMGNGDDSESNAERSSIPMPGFEQNINSEEAWNPRESMSEEGYERLRKGYERGINPVALEQMEEHQGSVRQFPPPAPSYAESTTYGAGAESDVASSGLRKEPLSQWEPDVAKHQGRIGPVAVAILLFVGITGGLLLYAGGAEYIGNLFTGSPEEPEENLTLVTERPYTGEDVQSARIMISDGEDEVSGEGVPEDVASEANTEIEADISSANDIPDLNTQGSDNSALEEARIREEALREEQRLAAVEEQRRKDAAEALAARRAQEKAREQAVASRAEQTTTRPAVDKSETRVKPVVSETTGAGSWVVQVIATQDKAEADRVARALRTKGGKDVHVVVTDKADETMYRVRFGSFTSQAEAKTNAGALGYKNVWVVKQ